MELRRLQAELGSLVRSHAPLRAAVLARAHADMAEARAIAARKREERVLLGKLREFRRTKHSARAYSRSPGGGPTAAGYASGRASPVAGGGAASPRPRRARRADAEAASPEAIAALALPLAATPGGGGGSGGRMPALPPLVLDMCVPPSLPGRGRGAPRPGEAGAGGGGTPWTPPSAGRAPRRCVGRWRSARSRWRPSCWGGWTAP